VKELFNQLSTKQKVNTSSSTEVELVSLDDVISKISWAKLFLELQGYEVNNNISKRDNISLDDVISKISWTKLFLEEQGYEVNNNILKRDNISS
jgi:hypothetical protein